MDNCRGCDTREGAVIFLEAHAAIPTGTERFSEVDEQISPTSVLTVVEIGIKTDREFDKKMEEGVKRGDILLVPPVFERE